jgi:hypothetical protein
MLTAAGVVAPDGNELTAFQTGLWGAFLQQLQHRHPQGLDHAWVSFFTYHPHIGAAIFAEWVHNLPNLRWLSGQRPLAVEYRGDRPTQVHFPEFTVQAEIIIDATELGDLLALGEIGHRWGWEWRSEWQEPSAPLAPDALTDQYAVQAPTWVVVLQDWGEGAIAPEIVAPDPDYSDRFVGAWDGYGPEQFLNYGRLPGDRFMINWPHRGNDYGQQLDRLVQSDTARQEFLQEAHCHSQQFASFIQSQLGRRYGLADAFPQQEGGIGGGAYALHPYYRESRRVRGVVTVCEQDILPIASGQVARLPVDEAGQVTAIALGNYANDHHYPGYEFPLQPKSIRWGGRWTGTPFTLPYGCLIPETTEGMLVCEKNISVSHIANGATRLQPIVLSIGQAAGMAAALCIERRCQPRDLTIYDLQIALLTEPTTPMAIVPLFNLPPDHPNWLVWQRYYLDHPEVYPIDGQCPLTAPPTVVTLQTKPALERKSLSDRADLPPSLEREFSGQFQRWGEQHYTLILDTPAQWQHQTLTLVTLDADINEQLCHFVMGQPLRIWGRVNWAGRWIRVTRLGL